MKDTNQLKKYIQAKRRLEQKLREITREIEQLEQKLAKYRMVKQGMMQELLTGRVRLV